MFFNTSREGDSTTFLDNLFQFSVTPAVKLFLIQVELPVHQFLLLVLLLSTTEQSLTPSSSILLENFHPLGSSCLSLPFEETHKEIFYTFLKRGQQVKEGFCPSAPLW